MKNLMLKSIWVGIFIAIGTLVFLSQYPSPLGALLFSCGLLSIFILEMKLFTGAVTFLDKNNYLDVLVVLLFNLLGCCILFLLPKNESAIQIIEKKLIIKPIYLFIDSMLCGVAISSAVLSHQRGKTWMAIVYVMVFILSGFNHSIANTCLVISSRIFTLKTLELILVSIFGNAVGSIIFYRTGVFK